MLYSNVKTIDEANIILVGIPDESKSKAPRKGSSGGPFQLRKALYTSETFKRSGKIIPICPMGGKLSNKKIFDQGNVGRNTLYNNVYKLVSARKFPILIGGDHSITTIALKAINESLSKKINLIYFDAHPDFVTSKKDYYGSILSDSINIINIKKSIFIGLRACEPEEITNLKKYNAISITPIDIQNIGIKKVIKKIFETCLMDPNDCIYVSIDLDCLDPAFAPGVSVPTPCGLSTTELVFLVKQIFEHTDNVIGCDIVELNPSYDINHITANFAARLVNEIIGSISVGND